MTVRTADFVMPALLPEIVTGVEKATALVVMVNPGEYVAPAGIVTLCGTLAAAGFELERVITIPPVGAGPLTPTLLVVTGVPPVMVVDESFSPEIMPRSVGSARGERLPW